MTRGHYALLLESGSSKSQGQTSAMTAGLWLLLWELSFFFSEVFLLGLKFVRNTSPSLDKPSALLISASSGSLLELRRRSEASPLHSDDWLTRRLSECGLLEELRLSRPFSRPFSRSALWLDEQEPFRFFLCMLGLLHVFSCFGEGGLA